MEEPLVSSCDRNRPVLRGVAWLRKALVAVLCAVLGHLPLHLLIAVAVCITAALLVVSVRGAQAEVPGLLPDGQFESQGALGVAVDQSTSESDPSRGDLYVAGFLGANSEGLLFGEVNKFNILGGLISSFGESGIYGSAAVNPANGDVYVLKDSDSFFSFELTVDIHPATGAPVKSFPVEGSGNYNAGSGLVVTVVGIAADSEGNVYVPVVPKNEVLEYSESKTEPGKWEVTKTFTGGSGGGEFNGPTGVVVDPAGNLWVADTGNNRIEELTSSDTVVRDIASEGVGSVAVDAHGNVFAIVNNSVDFCGAIKSPCSHLVEYSPAGVQVADLGAGVIGANQFGPEEGKGRQRQAVPDMVAVSDATGRVYVTEAVLVAPAGGTRGRVLKFRLPVAPTLGAEAAVEVGVSQAKLGAVVNPGGLGGSYRFEYGTTTAYGNSVPFPEGDTGAGFIPRTVWAGVSGLQPGTTYHYRAVVAGALGKPIMGNDQTFTTATAARSACPNERFRTSFSAGLPDCRAYELVTPPNKNSAQPDKNEGGGHLGELHLSQTLANNLPAADGSRLAFRAEDVLPGSPSADESYVATRGSGGWSSENMFPPTDYYGYKCPLHTFASYSEDLSKAIIHVGSVGQQCGVDPELVSGEPRGSENENLFVRDNATGTYQLINVTPEGIAPATPTVLGVSRDYSRIVFREKAKLTPDAPVGVDDVYEWSAGHVRLATVLPDGTAVAGAFADLAADGSRVFFNAGGRLYARVGGSETVQLDASEAGGAGGGASFVKASHDGLVVLFTADASAGLTSDTVHGSGPNLYRYDFSAPAGHRLADLTPVAHAVAPAVGGISKNGSTVFFTDEDSAGLTPETVPGSGKNLYRYESGRLIDLTPAEHAEVQSVLGVGGDGSSVSVYFTAGGVLSSVSNGHETAQAGQGNVYVSRGAGSVFVAGGAGKVRVSENGGFLLFESGGKPTGYDNVNPATGEPAEELYLYDAAANSLACASCNPSGEPPTGFAQLGVTHPGGPDSEGGAIEEVEGRAPRQLSENGQVFFDSSEGLLPADTNGKADCSGASGFPACTDVYEFEPDGAGSCAEPTGCLSLISTGTGSLETLFIDSSPSGNDVFIREFQKLVPRDTQDEAPSLYDVRVNGGFPEPAPPPPCTTAEACRTAPAPQPSIFSSPASQTFSGIGNLIEPSVKPPVKCKKSYVKKKDKCVKKKPKRRARRKPTHANRKKGR
jgi:hypothetical protein